MNKYATETSHHRVLVWIIWFVVLVACLMPHASRITPEPTTPLLGVVVHDARQSGPLFPWQCRWRWKKWAWRRYKAWRAASRRAKRTAQMARWALSGMLTMAQVVDWLTAGQLRYKLGALPVLYALLETLSVRQIINRHCATRAEVDHGTVALVLVLNRLLLPLPLYQISDWVGQTVLVAVLGIPAAKFNDDRLGRSLDALYPHLDVIWREIVERALVKADIDLSVIFYDLSAFVGHGRYSESGLIEVGFTPQLIYELYTQRWQVEIFFNLIKHVLTLENIISQTRNGIMIVQHGRCAIEIYSALILYLLTRIVMALAAQKTDRSLHEFSFERSHKLIRGFMLSHFHLFLQPSLHAVECFFQQLVDIVAAMGLAATVPKIVDLNNQLA